MLAYFAADLSRQALAPSTIRVYTAAVAAIHRAQGLPDPSRHNSILALVKRGMSRVSQHRQATRNPITPRVLRRILQATQQFKHLCRQDRRMLRAAFCTAFSGFLRVSEFTSPSHRAFDPSLHTTLKDLQWHKNHVSLFLKRSKTDQQGRGVSICLPKVPKSFCPFAALYKYGKHIFTTTPWSTPLFHFRNGRPLTRQSCCHHLRAALYSAGYNPMAYNTHSFRIGAATTAAAAGMSSKTIMRHGRWRSSAYKRYIHTTNFA